MKILLSAVCLFAITVHAQEIQELKKPVKCSDKQFVFEQFAKLYNETPIWSSPTEQGTGIVMLYNASRKSWSLVEYNQDMACILGTGIGGTIPNDS